MRLSDHVARLIAPDRANWKPMFAGLALFAGGAGAAVLLQPSPLALIALALALAAWMAGACAMVGYLRWFLGSEAQQAAREAARNRDR